MDPFKTGVLSQQSESEPGQKGRDSHWQRERESYNSQMFAGNFPVKLYTNIKKVSRFFLIGLILMLTEMTS